MYAFLGRRGSLHSHRPADALIDPAHAAILFRDSRGVSAKHFSNVINESLNEVLSCVLPFLSFVMEDQNKILAILHQMLLSNLKYFINCDATMIRSIEN